MDLSSHLLYIRFAPMAMDASGKINERWELIGFSHAVKVDMIFLRNLFETGQFETTHKPDNCSFTAAHSLP